MPELGTLSSKAIDQLNSLLRGEISAVETYRHAIEKADDLPASYASTLRSISQEHADNVRRLREEVVALGGDADDSSGAWGAWAKSIEKLGSLFGAKSALKVLKEGEEHGLKDYESALEELQPSTRKMISETMIASQRMHIGALDGILSAL